MYKSADFWWRTVGTDMSPTLRTHGQHGDRPIRDTALWPPEDVSLLPHSSVWSFVSFSYLTHIFYYSLLFSL